MKTDLKIALGAFAVYCGYVFWRARKGKQASGVGAAKRRVFKELSLAQKAGVDFSKKYDELSPSEIKALQKVSNDTGYTETYYKSLKKAYDAISGIGASYDVVNADGETVLTWIEDPENPQVETARKAIDDAERYLALREAREIEDDREWARQDGERKREELEARLAEQRKRLKKAGRSSQMQLFGIGETPTYSKQQIDSYVGTHRDLSFMFMRDDDGKIFVDAGDETGGRGFYVGYNNFKYLLSYVMKKMLPFAIWQGDHWMVRNDKYDILGFGVGYTPDVETELYEIWREQLDYGETDYDYDTWRSIYGDEYLKSSDIRYM